MIERAEGATPEEMVGPARAPGAGASAGAASRRRRSTGRTIRRGARRRAATAQARRRHLRRRCSPGKAATIERIYVDYEDGVHLGVTVDDDPGQDLMRESGRYLFFKPEEVELR